MRHPLYFSGNFVMRLRGFGLGYRPKHYREALERKDARVDWFEIVSENFMGLGGRPRRFLERLRAEYPLAMHGVSLSLASAKPEHVRYLKELKALADIVQPEMLSDHLCWTSHDGKNTHDLLPLPYTSATLAEMVRRVGEIQDFLGRRLYLENPSAYVALSSHEMDEADFLAELARRSGCGILLDVNNVYVCYLNLGWDPIRYLEKIPRDAVGYFHLAGHSQGCGVVIDTHDHAVADEVWTLYRHAARLFPEAPTLVEWDDKLPSYAELVEELDKARLVHAEAKEKPLSRVEIDLAFPKASQPEHREEIRGAAAVQSVFHDMMTQSFDPGDEADERLSILSVGAPVERTTGMLVYHNAYFLRLRDIIRMTFPVLASLLDDDGFESLVRRYLDDCPPEHFSVKFCGARLATWLASGRYEGDFGIPARHLADVVRLEWLLEELYDVKDEPVAISRDALGDIAPDAWDELVVTVRPTVAVLESEIRAGDVVNAVQAGETPSRPEHDPCWYVVYRQDDDVHWREIDARQYFLFNALIEHGHFPKACEAMAERFELALEDAAAEAVQHLALLIEFEGGGNLGQALVAEALPVAPPPPPRGDRPRA